MHDRVIFRLIGTQVQMRELEAELNDFLQQGYTLVHRMTEQVHFQNIAGSSDGLVVMIQLFAPNPHRGQMVEGGQVEMGESVPMGQGAFASSTSARPLDGRVKQADSGTDTVMEYPKEKSGPADRTELTKMYDTMPSNKDSRTRSMLRRLREKLAEDIEASINTELGAESRG